MSTAVAPLNKSLYELEEDLQAFADTEAFVTDADREEFEREQSLLLQRSIEKRDRYGKFLAHVESQAALCAAEIKRLQERKRHYESTYERCEQYLIRVIESLGQDVDKKGKPRWKKLEGQTVTFGLAEKPGHVEIEDEAAVPAEYKTATVTLPAELWDLVLDEFRNDDEDDPVWADLKAAAQRASIAVAKAEVKKAIEAGSVVPGADIIMGGRRLVVR
jgi:hypothetical protein